MKLENWKNSTKGKELFAELKDALRRPVALTLAAIVGWLLLHYPVGAGWLAAGLFLYAVLLWHYPSGWLFFVPALLPVLNLAPWTGWFFIDEFDLFLFVTLAISLWRRRKEMETISLPTGARWLVGLFALSYVTSTFIGLVPLQALDANAFSNYYSNYNSMRTAKGFFWLLAFLPLLHQELTEPTKSRNYLLAGMLAGLFGVGVVATWERQVFSGLLNFSKGFRITGTFFDMHTGGAYIDGYLATTLPLVASCFLFWRSKLAYFSGLVLFGSGIYTLLVTFSRIDYLAFGLSFLTLFVGLACTLKHKKRFLIVALLFAAAASLLTIPVLSGPYIQKRFDTTRQDLNIRLEHWKNAIQMMDSDVMTLLFGMGLGTYPKTYFCKNPDGKRPASYRYMTESGNTYLSLGSGDFLYMAQKISISPGYRYTLRLDLRSNEDSALLAIVVSEKLLLDSFRGKWLNRPVGNTQGQWAHHELSFLAGEIGEGTFFQRRPVQLALYNSRRNATIEVDNVQLMDERGQNLIRNGDFTEGNDHWFFTTDNHLPWHIKNLWVSLLFEQGWIGFLLFDLLLLYVLTRLVIRTRRGDLFSLLLLSSLIGFLTVGLVDSLFDSPRIAILFFLVLFVSLLHSGQPNTALYPQISSTQYRHL